VYIVSIISINEANNIWI